jgi:hypothetical protein
MPSSGTIDSTDRLFKDGLSVPVPVVVAVWPPAIMIVLNDASAKDKIRVIIVILLFY